MRISDWSSDVCSSDLLDIGASADADMIHIRADDAIIPDARIRADLHIANNLATGGDKGARMDFRALAAKRQYQWVHDYPSIRSEERRVGEERVSTGRSRWSPFH